jgi:hypothetical protein
MRCAKTNVGEFQEFYAQFQPVRELHRNKAAGEAKCDVKLGVGVGHGDRITFVCRWQLMGRKSLIQKLFASR